MAWRAGGAVAACGLLLTGGCVVAGLAAQMAPPPRVNPMYRGLQGESVAVMVWAERPIRIDFSPIQLDTAAAIQHKLRGSRARELEGTSWPLESAAVVRFQQNHPEWEALPVTDFAPRLGVSRLIYVEVEHFQTRSNLSLELYRGSMVGTVKVIEVEQGEARVAYEENDVQAIFPPNAPSDGIPHADDYRIYMGTIDAFAQEVVKRFVTHQGEW